MLQEHLDSVWRAALAASGDHDVAEAVTTAVLGAARRDAAEDELVRRAVLAAVRRAPAPAFARMPRAEREAVALARIARCPVAEVAAALGIGDGAARQLLTAGLRSARHRRPASAPRTLPPVLGCGIAAS
ncbi:MAG: sigma factor-like helix-turn-helix DNA-binding protein [Solirubrobacteraceae bacterium]|jgi:DNA-directed RNA polymerase specialized sigma24 family protein|nr:sigma factor-like helix-turn-helix DNA-binding protein [Solirubrobacteraceae bacterium]